MHNVLAMCVTTNIELFQTAISFDSKLSLSEQDEFFYTIEFNPALFVDLPFFLNDMLKLVKID
jgi:hypothetical protein